MPFIVELPTYSLGTFGKSIGKFMHLLKRIQKADEGKIVLDFKRSRMLNPFLLGGLANVIHSYTRNGYDFVFDFGANTNIQSYLNTICFPNGCDARGLTAVFERLRFKSYIPTIKFPAGILDEHETIRDQYLEGVANLIRLQLGMSEVQGAPVNYLLSELSTKYK
jgi:hypothetical protein